MASQFDRQEAATGPLAPAAGSAYYHADHQGSVRALTGEDGAVLNAYAYTAYGGEESAVEALAQPLRYTGREYDADTGLYHYRARAYDPATGRFLQEDPLFFGAGDLNLYRYTWNNPLNWTDPSGMAAASERAGLAPISQGLVTGLTINRLRAVIWVASRQGTRCVLQQVVQSTAVADKGLGCQIGVTLSSIAATISGATSAAIDGDNCTVVWNEEADNPSDEGPNGPRPPTLVEPKNEKKSGPRPKYEPPSIEDPHRSDKAPGPGWTKRGPSWFRKGPRGKAFLYPDFNHAGKDPHGLIPTETSGEYFFDGSGRRRCKCTGQTGRGCAGFSVRVQRGV